MSSLVEQLDPDAWIASGRMLFSYPMLEPYSFNITLIKVALRDDFTRRSHLPVDGTCSSDARGSRYEPAGAGHRGQIAVCMGGSQSESIARDQKFVLVVPQGRPA